MKSCCLKSKSYYVIRVNFCITTLCFLEVFINLYCGAQKRIKKGIKNYFEEKAHVLDL